MHLSLSSKLALCLTSLTICSDAVFGIRPALAASFSVVAEGLDNVRGLNFAPDGSLYITESGVGGDGRCIPGPSLEGLNSCVGNSGAVTRVKDGKQERILTELPSIALRPIGTTGEGPQDIQFDGSEGFTQLTDLEFDAKGNLYTVQYSNAPQWTVTQMLL